MLYTEIPTRALELTYRPTDCNTLWVSPCIYDETQFYFALSGKSRKDAVCSKADVGDGHGLEAPRDKLPKATQTHVSGKCQ